MGDQAQVYMIIGSTHYQADSAISLAKNLSLSLNHDSFLCASALDRSSVHSGLDVWRKSKEENGFSRLLLLRDLHRLDESNIKNLDFIFEVTDRYRRVKGLIVMLMSNYFDDNESTEQTQNEWRERVTTRFHSAEKMFNGVAFTGRILKFFIGTRDNSQSSSSSRDNEDTTATSFECNRIQIIMNKFQKVKKTVPTGVKFSIETVYSIMAVMLAPLLYCHYIILMKRI